MYTYLKVMSLMFCSFTKIYMAVNFYLSCLKFVVLFRSEFWCLLTILGKCFQAIISLKTANAPLCLQLSPFGTPCKYVRSSHPTPHIS